MRCIQYIQRMLYKLSKDKMDSTQDIKITSNVRRIKSLKEMAYSAIKRSIVNRQLQPEFIYTETEISTQLSISRTPVREALQILASESFVDLIPYKGFSVKIWTRSDAGDLYRLRIMFELAIIREIATTVSTENIRRLKRNEKETKRMILNGNIIEQVEGNRIYHSLLSELTRNKHIIAEYNRISDHIDLISAGVPRDSMTPNIVTKQHMKITNALCKHDLDESLQAMEDHLTSAMNRVLSASVYV